MRKTDRDTDVTPPEERSTARRPSRRAWIVGGVLAVLLVGFGIPAFLTATPGQCASCHEMQPYYDSWRSSSHRGAATNCRDCHVKPGLFNLVVYELAFYGEIVGHFTGAEVVPHGEQSANSCQQDACHSLNREASNSGDLKINHREHVVDAELACSECHPGAVHEGVDGRLRVPPMETCRECHEDEMDDCDYCHAGKVVPEAPDTH